jgi:hypothetical protein
MLDADAPRDGHELFDLETDEARRAFAGEIVPVKGVSALEAVEKHRKPAAPAPLGAG